MGSLAASKIDRMVGATKQKEWVAGRSGQRKI